MEAEKNRMQEEMELKMRELEAQLMAKMAAMTGAPGCDSKSEDSQGPGVADGKAAGGESPQSGAKGDASAKSLHEFAGL